MSLDSRNSNMEVLILRAKPYGEKDRLLTLLSAEEGLVKALAKGAAQGKLRGSCQPYSRSQLTLTPPKGGLRLVAGGLPLETYVGLSSSLEQMACAAYMSELATAAAHPEQPEPGLYYPLQAAWSMLKLGGDTAAACRFFELRLLRNGGLLPPLDSCSACGCQTEPGKKFFLDPAQGQLLCEACAPHSPWPVMWGEAARLCQELAWQPLDKLPSLIGPVPEARQAAKPLRAYSEYLLEYASQVRKVARKLLE